MISAIALTLMLCAVSALALSEADPIRVSSLSEPQSVISEQDVSVTIKVYNSGQQDMEEEITLYNSDGLSVDKYAGLKAEQSVTYTGTWHVTSEQIARGRINYYIKYTVDTGSGPSVTTRTVPVTIQTEEAAPQLTATYTLSPAAARKGQTVEINYALINTGNVELRNIVISNAGVSSKDLTTASLSVGEKVTVTDSFVMGDSERVSNPTITYTSAESSRTYTISDMARRTVTLSEDGLEAAITADNTQNIYPGESITLHVTLKNSGNTAYSSLSAVLPDGTAAFSGVELAAGASFEQDISYTPTGDTALVLDVTGRDANGENVQVVSESLPITTQEADSALILRVRTQAQTQSIYTEPAVVRFALVVENIGQTDATTLTVKEAGTTVATIPSLPSGESRTLVFDIETSIAGQIQFTVSGRDALGVERSYESNVVTLTYIAPTPEPSATPAPTAVPATPSPVPTASPVPSIGEIIAQHVNPIVLYIAAAVLAVALAALLFVNTMQKQKRKKRLEQALDTIERSPDMRDSFGRCRRRRNTAKPEKKADEPAEPIVHAPELDEKSTDELPNSEPAAQNVLHGSEQEESRRRHAQPVNEDQTLRVAPVEERPAFVSQGKVDSSQTRIFSRVNEPKIGEHASDEAEQSEAPKQGKVDAEDAVKQTPHLDAVEMDEARRRQLMEEALGDVQGKTRKEIKPMKKAKKGLFGRKKSRAEEDDFLEEIDPTDDSDDDFFE